MKKAIRLFIQGTVQGIFFRQFIKEHAEKNKVAGFLRNLEDGRVEIFLEGNTENVDAMAAVCRRGPSHSNIRNVEEKPERLQDFKEFKIFNF
ncbi:acylphosphatase [Candidatus Pacearchaeota archaeon]|nr:acylphosphatase [Candidatus Pacearchaeota archaeon]